jgi:hypothetical protein
VTHRIDPQPTQTADWLLARCGIAVRESQRADPGREECPTCRAMGVATAPTVER